MNIWDIEFRVQEKNYIYLHSLFKGHIFHIHTHIHPFIQELTLMLSHAHSFI